MGYLKHRIYASFDGRFLPKVFQCLLSSVGSACVGQYFEDLPDHPVTSTLEVRISHVPS